MFTDERNSTNTEWLVQEKVSCPYCGELIEVLIDHQEAGQSYIEDCQVCCRPITFNIFAGAGGQLEVSVHDENETI
ncbi:MAG: CPXCG motif-containing cysteine-rich protein [Halioglobus sp.]|nr:CPXCG motif-containing cysteine-rich protein [Halioglobus sp.]